jgi:hypothetical protein
MRQDSDKTNFSSSSIFNSNHNHSDYHHHKKKTQKTSKIQKKTPNILIKPQKTHKITKKTHNKLTQNSQKSLITLLQTLENPQKLFKNSSFFVLSPSLLSI